MRTIRRKWLRVLTGIVAVIVLLIAGIAIIVSQDRKAKQRSEEERLAFEIEHCMKDLSSGASDEIYLYGMHRTDDFLEHFRDMPEIHTVTLEDTDISEAGMVHIATMPNLESLAIEIADRIGNASLEAIAEHPHIEKLHLYNTHISDNGLAFLKSLPSLDTLWLHWSWRGDRPTDAGLVHLKELSNLKTLIIGGDWISASGVEQLRNALPQCDVRLQGWTPPRQQP